MKKKLEFIKNHQGSRHYTWLSNQERIQEHLTVLEEHYGNKKDAIDVVFRQLSK